MILVPDYRYKLLKEFALQNKSAFIRYLQKLGHNETEIPIFIEAIQQTAKKRK